MRNATNAQILAAVRRVGDKIDSDLKARRDRADQIAERRAYNRNAENAIHWERAAAALRAIGDDAAEKMAATCDARAAAERRALSGRTEQHRSQTNTNDYEIALRTKSLDWLKLKRRELKRAMRVGGPALLLFRARYDAICCEMERRAARAK